jgi:hypothetical protein
MARNDAVSFDEITLQYMVHRLPLCVVCHYVKRDHLCALFFPDSNTL